jgi:hypothetical protein
MRFASLCCSIALFVTAPVSIAETAGGPLGTASQEQTAEAVGHYARARALIIAAIHEFDRGRRIARPDDLMEPARWRNTLIDRAEDLERILDPQPRVSKGGIQYSPDSRLLPEARK